MSIPRRSRRPLAGAAAVLLVLSALAGAVVGLVPSAAAGTAAPPKPADPYAIVNWYRSFGGRLRDRAPLPGLAASPTLQASANNVVQYLAGLAAQGINACTHGQVPGHPWAAGEDHTHNVLACGEPSLTPRQAEILDLLAEGHGNKEIRHRLGIAERTVRAHLTELFQLLDAHSRTQALIRAREGRGQAQRNIARSKLLPQRAREPLHARLSA